MPETKMLSTTVRKRCTIVGTFLMLMPCGMVQSWGNVSIYLYSYMFVATQSPSVGVQSPWILSLIITVKVIVLTTTGRMVSKVGKRKTSVLGILLFAATFATSYFTIGRSFVAFTSTIAILLGSASGVLEGVTLKYVIDWSDADTGKMTTRLFAAYSAGSVLINQFVTMYINPENMTPDVIVDDFAFFTQAEVLDKVPKMLLWYGIISLAIQLIGVALVREPSTGNNVKKETEEDGTVKEYGACETNLSEENRAHTVDEIRGNGNQKNSVEMISNRTAVMGHLTCSECKSNTQVIYGTNVYHQEGVSRIEYFVKCKHCKTTLQKDGSEIISKPFSVTTEIDKKENNNSISERTEHENTTKQSFLQEVSTILRSPSIYVLWIGYFFIDTVNISIGNFQKTYGELHIHDDHFFSTMATVMGLVFLVMRFCGGYIMDIIHHKTLMIGLLALSSILQFLMYFSAFVNQWFYFVATTLAGGVMSIASLTWMVATVKTFGKETANTSFGLMMTSAIAIYLLAAPVFAALLTIGWFEVFLWPASMCVVGLIVTAVFLKHENEK